jgi:predicted phage terminase large subunit-like protein
LGRTNLLWLCNEVLGFKDVCDEVHGPIIRIEQQFSLPPSHELAKLDIVQPGFIKYRPWKNPYDIPGKRRMLLLDPRGGLKTSINCVAHTIQWILNYPHLAYLIVQANAQKAEDIMREIKQHFQYNSLFREIYPDYCPQKRVNDWGNRQEFDVPDETGRAKILEDYAKIGIASGRTRKEHSCMTASIDKGTAGYHWDVMKFSDIVEENNTRTPEQMKQVTYTFNMMENLLVRPTSWIDVEGTRYKSGDLYGQIIDSWEASPDYRAQWKIHVRSCYIRAFKEEGEERFTPDTLRLPFQKDDKGNKISWWPNRVSLADLKRKEIADKFVFATQQLNDPVGGDDDMKIFPMKYMQWIDPKEFAKIPIAYFQTSVDTADTVGLRANNSVITTCAFDKFGRCYIVDVILGKMLPDDLIANILAVNRKFKPRKMIIEETSFVRGLKPSIRRQTDLHGVIIPLEFVKRDNTTSKQERIQNTLQPWFKAKEIILLENLADKDHIIREFDRFPTWDDDFLDTLADQFQNREWFGREAARAVGPEQIRHQQKIEEQKAWARYYKVEDPFDPDNDYAVPIPEGSTTWRTGAV